MPEIFDVVKYHVDRQDFQPGKYILTGSSQLRLRENISDSMADRMAFPQKQYLTFDDKVLRFLATSARRNLPATLDFLRQNKYHAGQWRHEF